ncbi:VWFA and cache domain-containing protein 1-like [Saccoglossus kowalevskii]|uniref:Voltage-dependent calcium channel subunit alpha-2/delta-1-like n=1 Tax=Saccoglossus kowalevskii TaxID=10224 RepID=A0ABM0GR49_SACKO|nr:PREDICTED: voltage-dependent calcium channel subunit alpha-2/delta-1-like [Saccoglossus kowalevskii]
MELYICKFRAAILLLSVVSLVRFAHAQYTIEEEKWPEGKLAADVQNWALVIQNYILELASDGLKTSHMQSFYDKANYTMEHKDGFETLQRVKSSLRDYFSKKEQAARRIAEAVATMYDNNNQNAEVLEFSKLQDVPYKYYKDSDIPNRLPRNMEFSPYFKQKISSESSVVKISDEVPRDSNVTINTVMYTYGLDEVFKQNNLKDPLLRWQYFGSKDGILRMYPGREWDTNFAGFYNDYDPRVRPWYIAATSGPKDVAIILDCSYSMTGKKFEIGKAVVKTILNTLTKQDYVNVICARASHWDEVGKWHLFSTDVLSCQDNRLVPASTAHRKDLKEKIETLVPGGTSELHYLTIDDGEEFPGRLACENRGSMKKLLSGNNLISQMNNYFEFLSSNTEGTQGLWTSPYLDAWGLGLMVTVAIPAVSKISNKVIGVAGIDATLEEIENLIVNEQWGSVYAFLVNNEGETIFHPLLKPSSKLVDDPIFIPISKLEQRDGKPAAFAEVEAAMRRGESGSKTIEDAYRGLPKARIFSYLTIDDGEEFPGRLACENRGSMKKLLSGNNLISQMNNYFEFLSSNTEGTQGLWTSPYLDAWGLGLMVTVAIPAVSKISNKVIGVAGIDATLEEIENLIVNEQWGSVYAFLVNNEGETIFHPLLKPSSKLVDDPIFIPISKLEQRDGKPAAFAEVEAAMRRGESGSKTIEDAYRGLPKGDFADGVKLLQQPATYYYTALNASVYAFAFNLAESDSEFRRTHEPEESLRKTLPTSIFNLIIKYDSELARQKLPGLFEKMKVEYNLPKYPQLRVTYLHSSFMLAPKCYCDPNSYLFDEDLANKTVTAHLFMNGNETAKDCPNSIYEKNIRADVLITSQIEEIWKTRKFDLLDDVKWTYIGCRSGVFRTYPGHRSRRTYDPTKRPWYHRTMTNPEKTAISTAYMDAAGVGKIISISQAIFEGMPLRTQEECDMVEGLKPGGCVCESYEECLSGHCYHSEAPGYMQLRRRCASEKVEAVTALDILYKDFHNNVYLSMQSSDGERSCRQTYRCPNGEDMCQTRCYLFDNFANLVTDPEFIHASDLDERQYKRVSLGKKEGEVMHELIYKHGFFERKEQIDFQGSCSVSPYSPKVTLDGIAKTPEELDDYFRTKGPIPSFSNNFGCIQDVVGYQANSSALGPSGMITGNVTGACKSGFYYLTALPKTNLFLLVIENWRNDSESNFFNFNCRITNRFRALQTSNWFYPVTGTLRYWR